MAEKMEEDAFTELAQFSALREAEEAIQVLTSEESTTDTEETKPQSSVETFPSGSVSPESQEPMDTSAPLAGGADSQNEEVPDETVASHENDEERKGVATEIPSPSESQENLLLSEDDGAGKVDSDNVPVNNESQVDAGVPVELPLLLDDPTVPYLERVYAMWLERQGGITFISRNQLHKLYEFQCMLKGEDFAAKLESSEDVLEITTDTQDLTIDSPSQNDAAVFSDSSKPEDISSEKVARPVTSSIVTEVTTTATTTITTTATATTTATTEGVASTVVPPAAQPAQSIPSFDDRNWIRSQRRHKRHRSMELFSRVIPHPPVEEALPPNKKDTSKGAIPRVSSVVVVPQPTPPATTTSGQKEQPPLAKGSRCRYCKSRTHSTEQHSNPAQIKRVEKAQREKLRNQVTVPSNERGASKLQPAKPAQGLKQVQKYYTPVPAPVEDFYNFPRSRLSPQRSTYYTPIFVESHIGNDGEKYFKVAPTIVPDSTASVATHQRDWGLPLSVSDARQLIGSGSSKSRREEFPLLPTTSTAPSTSGSSHNRQWELPSLTVTVSTANTVKTPVEKTAKVTQVTQKVSGKKEKPPTSTSGDCAQKTKVSFPEYLQRKKNEVSSTPRSSSSKPQTDAAITHKSRSSPKRPRETSLTDGAHGQPKRAKETQSRAEPPSSLTLRLEGIRSEKIQPAWCVPVEGLARPKPSSATTGVATTTSRPAPIPSASVTQPRLNASLQGLILEGLRPLLSLATGVGLIPPVQTAVQLANVSELPQHPRVATALPVVSAVPATTPAVTVANSATNGGASGHYVPTYPREMWDYLCSNNCCPYKNPHRYRGVCNDPLCRLGPR